MSPLTCWLQTTDYRDKDWDMRAVARSPPLLAAVFTTKKVWKKLCPGSTSRNKCHLSENCVGQRPAACLSPHLHTREASRGVSAPRHVRHFYQNANNINVKRVCSQMTSAFLGVSDTPWCLCQPIISFWHAPWCFKLISKQPWTKNNHF